MKIVLGRDPSSGCLKASIDGGRMQVIKGTQGLSPMVSKDHLSLESEDGQHFILTNLNASNVTYVKDVPVMKYHVFFGDAVYMGIDRQPLDWELLRKTGIIPQYVDIRPLQQVYDGYQTALIDLQVRQQKSGVKRMMTPIFSILGSAAGGAIAQVFNVEGSVRTLVTLGCVLPGVLLLIYFIYKGFKEAEFFPRERKRLENEFKQAYACPQCHIPFGNQDYTMLKARKSCASCKAQFIS